MARVTVVGNLGGDAVTKVTPGGETVVELGVAVNSRRKEVETTAWYRVSAFGRLADSLDKLAGMGGLRKGSQVAVEGRLVPREYTDKNGQVRLSLDVVAADVVALGSRGDGGGGSPAENLDEVPW